MHTRATVQLEFLSSVYACEFDVLSLQCINESQSYIGAESLVHVHAKISSHDNIRLVWYPRSQGILSRGLYCLVYM